MQYNTTNDLNIVMQHVPGYQISCSHPFICPLCLITVDLLRWDVWQPIGDQNPSAVTSRNSFSLNLLAVSRTMAKAFGRTFSKNFFKFFISFTFNPVDFSKYGLLFIYVEIRIISYLLVQVLLVGHQCP